MNANKLYLRNHQHLGYMSSLEKNKYKTSEWIELNITRIFFLGASQLNKMTEKFSYPGSNDV